MAPLPRARRQRLRTRQQLSDGEIAGMTGSALSLPPVDVEVIDGKGFPAGFFLTFIPYQTSVAPVEGFTAKGALGLPGVRRGLEHQPPPAGGLHQPTTPWRVDPIQLRIPTLPSRSCVLTGSRSRWPAPLAACGPPVGFDPRPVSRPSLCGAPVARRARGRLGCSRVAPVTAG